MNCVDSTIQEQLTLLHTVLLSSEADLFDEEESQVGPLEEEREEVQFTKRTSQSLSSLSGGDSMAYLEYKKGSSSNLPKRYQKQF
jgi:DNA excision repair protein ERCC-3